MNFHAQQCTETLLELGPRLEKPSSPLESQAALGARCRRFESCLSDASKSQSPADILTASQGAVFY